MTRPSVLRSAAAVARIGRLPRLPPRARYQNARSRPYTTPTASSHVSSVNVPSILPPEPSFPLSPIPENPLGDGRCIQEAAALVIGDEILNGKTLDRNSNYLARYCFANGVNLIEASRRLTSKYDFVVTSGGIDITYASLAKAFGQTLQHHPETMRRMDAINAFRKTNLHTSPEQREAYLRMALFPSEAEVIFVRPEIWVPVVRLAGRLYVLPGIPALFQKMLDALTPFLPLPEATERLKRMQIFTDRRESSIAPYLTELQARLRPRGISVGSYPVVGKGVFISLIGRDGAGASESAGSSLKSSTPPPAPLTGLGAVSQSDASEGPIGNGDGEDVKTTTTTDSLSLAQIAEEVEQAVGGRIIGEEEVESVKQDILNGHDCLADRAAWRRVTAFEKTSNGIVAMVLTSSIDQRIIQPVEDGRSAQKLSTE
ncbi:Molybdopterin binding protein [Schizophyllum commune Loenen D]|nr:Molybdopterin binding protein [Schizophyllum commune Loenen D]